MSHPVYIPIEKNFTQTQVEMKDFLKAKNSISIGIPKESFYHENRVGLVPHSVHNLVARGHQVLVESGAGEKSNFSDHNYSEAGAQICYSRDQVFEANVILKVSPPSLEELGFFKTNQLLISPLQLPTN